MSDHYDILRDTQYGILGTNLAEVGTDCSEFPNNSDAISRQAAIDALKNDMASLDHIIKGMSANDVRLDAYVSQRNQVNYDIYTINNLPAVQSEQLSMNLAEVGTDCISRQAAIDAVLKCYDNDEMFEVYERELKELPSAQPERKRGKWIEYEQEFMLEGHTETVRKTVRECSICTAKIAGMVGIMNFCPNCGADMREVTE